MMTQFLRHYLLAVQFFTRLPITGRLAAWVGFSPSLLRASAAHFAGIGWLVGVVAAGAYALLLCALPGPYAPLVAAVLSTVATALLTGGFHEDGLADLADGLGGSYKRERALEIMKDSRIGAFGALALVLALLTKVGLLATLADGQLPWAMALIVASHVVSRALPMAVVALLAHVGDADGSKSKPLAESVSVRALLSNGVWCALAFALALHAQCAPQFIGGVTCAALAWAVMVWRLKVRLGGFTGDALGATQQVCEMAFLLGAALMLGAA